MTHRPAFATAFVLAAAIAASPAAAQVVGDLNAYEFPRAPAAPGTNAMKGSKIHINGKPVAVDGVLPPGARKAILVGADGKRFEITKIGPNQWQTASGVLPGLYHYRVVTVDQAGSTPQYKPVRLQQGRIPPDSAPGGRVVQWDHLYELPSPGPGPKTGTDEKITIHGNRTESPYDYPGRYAQRFDGIDKGGAETRRFNGLVSRFSAGSRIQPSPGGATPKATTLKAR